MLRDLTLTPAPATSPRGLRAGVRAVVFVLARWNQRRLTRASLAALPPHLLRDIGLSEADAQAEARKPFWEA